MFIFLLSHEVATSFLSRVSPFIVSMSLFFCVSTRRGRSSSVSRTGGTSSDFHTFSYLLGGGSFIPQPLYRRSLFQACGGVRYAICSDKHSALVDVCTRRLLLSPPRRRRGFSLTGSHEPLGSRSVDLQTPDSVALASPPETLESFGGFDTRRCLISATCQS